MSKITKVNLLPAHVEAWAMCRLLHKKRPIYTGKKIWIESLKEWRGQIIWVCDICKEDKIINSEKTTEE